MEELFSASWKEFHITEHFSYPFVAEHNFSHLLILNLHFNSSMCCRLLVLSIHLEIDNFKVYTTACCFKYFEEFKILCVLDFYSLFFKKSEKDFLCTYLLPFVILLRYLKTFYT